MIVFFGIYLLCLLHISKNDSVVVEDPNKPKPKSLWNRPHVMVLIQLVTLVCFDKKLDKDYTHLQFLSISNFLSLNLYRILIYVSHFFILYILVHAYILSLSLWWVYIEEIYNKMTRGFIHLFLSQGYSPFWVNDNLIFPFW